MINMIAANCRITVKTHRMTIAQMFQAWNDACKADSRPEMQLTDLFRFTRRDQIIAAVRRRRIQAEENFEADHAEALEMNAALDKEFASIDALAPDEDSKKKFKAIASKYEVGCVMGVSAAHEEALKMNVLIDHAEIAESSADVAAAWRDHINSPEAAQERFAEYSPKMKKHFVDRSHDEALRMNEGIDLALKIASLLNDCKYGVEGAMTGALIRDGYHEVDYLVQVAARKYAQHGTAEITAHGI